MIGFFLFFVLYVIIGAWKCIAHWKGGITAQYTVTIPLPRWLIILDLIVLGYVVWAFVAPYVNINISFGG